MGTLTPYPNKRSVDSGEMEDCDPRPVVTPTTVLTRLYILTVLTSAHSVPRPPLPEGFGPRTASALNSGRSRHGTIVRGGPSRTPVPVGGSVPEDPFFIDEE